MAISARLASEPEPEPRRAARTARIGPFGLALTLAFALHLALLLGVSFDLPTPSPQTSAALEVMVLREAAPREPPRHASALAQADRRGEGGHAETAPPKDEAPPDALEEGAPPLDLELAPPAPLAPTTPTALPPDPPGEPEPAPEPPVAPDLLAAETPAPVDVAQILSSRRAEIARLNTQIATRTASDPAQPRRKAVSASTREYKYATYLEAWRRKVERIGNLNYPEVAKARSLYGSLILLVSVRADGQVTAVRVLRSSGHPELDQAAVRIVELAAPFAPFPPDIRAETDVLDITRTWQFLHGHRLDSGR